MKNYEHLHLLLFVASMISLFCIIMSILCPKHLSLNVEIQPTFTVKQIKSLPKRRHRLKLKASKLKVKKIPHWISCPDAQKDAGIWSMAITESEAKYAAVLAFSIKVVDL